MADDAFISGLPRLRVGRPIHDDQHQFEHLCLESLQCGLSWLTILNKRNIIRECFDHFDIDAVAAYGESDIERIMQTEGMLKHRPKIEAIINNAAAFKRIQSEFGSFCNYIWGFTNHKTIIYENHPERSFFLQSNGLSLHGSVKT